MTERKKIEQGLWDLYEKVCNMNAAERAGLRRSVNRLTSTNCSWLIYEARSVLLSWLDMVAEWKGRKR